MVFNSAKFFVLNRVLEQRVLSYLGCVCLKGILYSKHGQGFKTPGGTPIPNIIPRHGSSIPYSRQTVYISFFKKKKAVVSALRRHFHQQCPKPLVLTITLLSSTDCRDKRNDCRKLIDKRYPTYYCAIYKGQCDVTCGVAPCLGEKTTLRKTDILSC